LFTAYTNSHRGKEPHTLICKYADDAALAGFIIGNDESHYRETISNFVRACHSDGLDLNVSKTKEMIIDFRRGDVPALEPVIINGCAVEQVPQYDYLGSRISKDLTWCANTDKLASKAMRNIYGLRKLREFKVRKQLLKLFYSSTVETALTFGIAVWGGSLTKREKRTLNRVRRCASRIIGDTLDHWDVVYHNRATSLANRIMSDVTHPLSSCFTKLPSGRRLRQPRSRTKRLRDSFVPSVIALINS